MEIDINNLPEGWGIEEGRKSRTTGKKRLFILNEVGKCVGASCSMCGAVLSVLEYSKKRGCKYGLRGYCKKCVSKEEKEYRKNNAERIKEYKKEYRKNSAEKIKEYYKEYNKNNAEKIKEYNKEYYKNNAEKIKEHNKEKSKEYYKNNAEKIKEYKKEYRKNNPEKVRLWKYKRRTRIQGNGGSFTDAQLKECLEFFNGCCAYTGEQLGSYDLDHIQPISKGGTSFIYNLVPATATANRSKGARDLEEWYKEQEYYSQERLNKILEWQEISFKMVGADEQGEV